MTSDISGIAEALQASELYIQDIIKRAEGMGLSAGNIKHNPNVLQITSENIDQLGEVFSDVSNIIRQFKKTPAADDGQLYRAVLPKGGLGLKAAKGGGFNGFVEMGDGKSKLAVFKPEGAGAAMPPINPTMIMMAATLIMVQQSLANLEEGQKEIFDYLKNKDKAELRGNLETLIDVLHNYQYNCNNEMYKANKHNLVQQIRNDAAKSIIQHRLQAEGYLEKKGPIHIDNDVRVKTTRLIDELSECRLAIYLHAFASVLEAVLLENYEAQYLEALASQITSHAEEYRQLYGRAHAAIDKEASSSVRAVALGGLSGAMKFLSRAIEQTPLGEATQVDEALWGGGKNVGSFSEDVHRGMVEELEKVKDIDVSSFVASVYRVKVLQNDPIMLLTDGDSLYVACVT